VFIILLFITGCAEKIKLADSDLAVAISDVTGKTIGNISKSDLAGLKKLDVHRKRNIVYLNGMEHCKNLEWLDASYNKVEDVSALSNLMSLQVLELEDNLISDASPLSQLNNLHRLNLCGNNINDLTPLIGLTKLQKLHLERNQISDISSLSNVTDVRILYLGSNKITNISPLEGLKRIGDWDGWALKRGGFNIHLTLSNNQISDISPLVTNSGIGEGDIIDLTGNPLNDEAYNAHIPILEKRGVVVLY